MNLQAISALAGRFLIGLIYVVSGVTKIQDYAGTAAYMATENMPMIPILEPAAIVVEIVFGICIIVGFKTRISALILAAYSVVATTIFNHFWNMEPGAMQATIMHLFMSTIAMVGACLFLAGVGAGPLSVDNRAKP